MRYAQQTTVARDALIEGVGLHSGVTAHVRLRPARAGQGVIFQRAGAPAVAAAADAVSNSRFNTGLGEGAARVATVEHLMAAIALAGIDNILVEIDGPELPALDGSAAPWLELLASAGVRTLGAPREEIRILAPVTLDAGDGRIIRAEPFDGRILDVAIDFAEAAIGAQRVVLDLDDPADVRRVARARTFCRREDIERLRASGLSLGGSFDNAVVVDGAAVLNPSGLRDPLEFALHKALDLIGDLRLAGAPVIGRVIAERPGHDINARFLAALGGDGVARGPAAESPVRVRA
ncbi:MAG TPA: UDP-3-O-[3-hydroxymyristoyl] N-acetylglucosamine deacetylase [Parvularcula sp.]|nr:UDP-3-O-[3-hydroxymyristoyl] N-acetylglucosamine deacetylase [Parvularcula sp.]